MPWRKLTLMAKQATMPLEKITWLLKQVRAPLRTLPLLPGLGSMRADRLRPRWQSLLATLQTRPLLEASEQLQQKRSQVRPAWLPIRCGTHPFEVRRLSLRLMTHASRRRLARSVPFAQAVQRVRSTA